MNHYANLHTACNSKILSSGDFVWTEEGHIMEWYLYCHFDFKSDIERFIQFQIDDHGRTFNLIGDTDEWGYRYPEDGRVNDHPLSEPSVIVRAVRNVIYNVNNINRNTVSTGRPDIPIKPSVSSRRKGWIEWGYKPHDYNIGIVRFWLEPADPKNITFTDNDVKDFISELKRAL